MLLLRMLATDRSDDYRCKVKFPRSIGILAHITSLPGRFGIGDLGPSAIEFAGFRPTRGQKLCQVLPLHPPDNGDSPYQCFSAFAGNSLSERALVSGLAQRRMFGERSTLYDCTIDNGDLQG